MSHSPKMPITNRSCRCLKKPLEQSVQQYLYMISTGANTLLTFLGHRLLRRPKQEEICQTNLDNLSLVTWLLTLEDFLFPILTVVRAAVESQIYSCDVRFRTTGSARQCGQKCLTPDIRSDSQVIGWSISLESRRCASLTTFVTVSR